MDDAFTRDLMQHRRNPPLSPEVRRFAFLTPFKQPILWVVRWRHAPYFVVANKADSSHSTGAYEKPYIFCQLVRQKNRMLLLTNLSRSMA